MAGKSSTKRASTKGQITKKTLERRVAANHKTHKIYMLVADTDKDFPRTTNKDKSNPSSVSVLRLSGAAAAILGPKKNRDDGGVGKYHHFVYLKDENYPICGTEEAVKYVLQQRLSLDRSTIKKLVSDVYSSKTHDELTALENERRILSKTNRDENRNFVDQISTRENIVKLLDTIRSSGVKKSSSSKSTKKSTKSKTVSAPTIRRTRKPSLSVSSPSSRRKSPSDSRTGSPLSHASRGKRSPPKAITPRSVSSSDSSSESESISSSSSESSTSSSSSSES